MKQIIKNKLFKYFPTLLYAIRNYKFYLHCRDKFYLKQKSFQFAVYRDNDIQVLWGPFVGLRYYNKVVWGSITNRWIGCFEMELHKVIHDIINKSCKTIINIGAAEGYYSVGLAYRLPKSTVVSYDISFISRRRQKQLSELNNITNIRILGSCDIRKLSLEITKNTVIICDIEGCEVDLLKPTICPELLQCDLLVEIHKHENLSEQDVKNEIYSRFQETHSILEFCNVERNVDELQRIIPELENVSPSMLNEAVEEHRNTLQYWLWIEKK